jgi:hypothetical protein
LALISPILPTWSHSLIPKHALEDYAQALVLPGLIEHVAGNLTGSRIMLHELAERGLRHLAQRDSIAASRALALSVRGAASATAILAVKGILSITDAKQQFMSYESIALDAVDRYIKIDEYKAQVYEVLGMGRGTLHLPDGLSLIQTARDTLDMSLKKGLIPRRVIKAQIGRSDFLIRLRNPESGTSEIYESAKQGLSIFLTAG